MTEYIRLSQLAAVLLYTTLGLIFLWGSFLIVDKMTPHDLWKEVCEKNNIALAILIGAISIGMSLIIAASIHG